VKKIFISICIILFIFFSILLGVSREQSSATISDAITRTGRSVSNILYEEDLKSNKFVIFTDKSNNICVAFIHETLWGYKFANWGGASLTIPYPIDSAFLPKYKGVVYPVVWGKVNDNKIAKVQFIDEVQNKDYDAKIIDTDFGRIYFSFLNETKGDKIKILGLDSAKTTIYYNYIDINYETGIKTGAK
jgi:hypothetical protein